MNALAELGVLVTVTHGYGLVLVAGATLSGSPLLTGERFTRAKFYALLGWVPLSFVVLALLHDVRFGLLFFAAGTLGIPSEVLVSLVWRAFFSDPLWTYSYGAVARGFTSRLNFLPWATGGLLFCLAGRWLRPVLAEPAGFPTRAAVVFAASLAVGLAVAWPLARFTQARRGEVTKASFALFCFPIALCAASLGALAGPGYLLAMAVFSLLGFATEYGYGRGMRVFFDRGLWTYRPFPIDGGHSSFATFPLWAIGGLFFHFLSRGLGL